MGNVRYVQERKVCNKFFDHLATDTGMIVFGIQDTMKALDLGALEVMILWEQIEVTRYEFRNSRSEENNIVHFLTDKQVEQKDPKFFTDQETGLELDIISQENLADWITESYKKFGI